MTVEPSKSSTEPDQRRGIDINQIIIDDLIEKFSSKLDPTLIISISLDHLSSSSSSSSSSFSSSSASTSTISTNDNDQNDREKNVEDLTQILSSLVPENDQALVDDDFQNLNDGEEEEGLGLGGPNRLAQPSSSPMKDSKGADYDDPESCLREVQALFPETPKQSILTAISKSSDPKDPNQVIGILLGDDPQLHQPQQARAQDLFFPANDNVSKKSKKRRKERKPNKRGLEKINLTDVFQSDERLRTQNAQNYYNQFSANQSNQNRWVTIDSQAIYIADLLNIKPEKVKAAFHLRNNMVVAMEDVLNELESRLKDETRELIENDPDRFETQLSFFKEFNSDFSDGFYGGAGAGAGSDEKLRRLLSVTEVDAGRAYDVLMFLKELDQQYGTLNYNFFHPSNQQDPTSPLVKNLISKTITNLKETSNINSSSSSSISSQEDFKLVNSPTKKNPSKEREDPTESLARTDLRADQLRLRVMNPSVHSFDRSKPSAGAISSICREDLRALRSQRVRWELDRVRRLVNDRRRLGKDSNSIDLHGLTRKQAIEITSEALEDWWENKTEFRKPFRIITGVGKHSKDFKPTLLPAIILHLNSNGWNWRSEYNDCSGELGGSIIVLGTK